MKVALVLCIAALVTSGCIAPTEEPNVDVMLAASVAPPLLRVAGAWRIVIDPDVPDARVAEIERALRDWETHVQDGCAFVYDVVRGPTGRFGDRFPPVGVIEVHAAEQLPQVGASGYGEWYPNAGSRVGFQPSSASWDFPRVVRHELGHAFGLEHDDATPGVMMRVGNVDAVSASDAASYAARWCRAI